MLREGHVPSHRTCAAGLDSCEAGGHWKLGTQLLDQMASCWLLRPHKAAFNPARAQGKREQRERGRVFFLFSHSRELFLSGWFTCRARGTGAQRIAKCKDPKAEVSSRPGFVGISDPVLLA